MTDDQQPTNSATNLTRRLNVEFALQAAGLGVWEYDPVSNQVLWDERCRALFGLAADNRMSYEQAFQYIYPDDVAQVDRAAQWVMNPESDGVFDQTYRTIGVDDGQLRWVRFQGRVDFASTGAVQRFAGVAQEVTQQVTAYQQLAAANEASATINEELLASNAQLAQVHRQLDRHNGRLANLISATPTATAVFTGRDMVIQQINAPMLAIWGKDGAVVGKTLHEAMPELEGQPFLAQLQHVFDTGEPFYYAEGMAEVIEQGQPKTVWFNHAYNPLYDADEIYGVINTVTDVTAQFLARQQIEASEAALRNAVELAQLGSFSVEVATNLITVSPRVADWFGFDSLVPDAQAFIDSVGQSDRETVQTSLANALQPGSDGRYDVVHSVVHAQTGRQIILHAVGQVYKDANGTAFRLESTCQDITSQRELQTVLEQQVQDRTEELAAANEELAATNEELIVTNEEMLASNQALETSNTDLVRSNQNLEQFAYIASHDLQEPLRKIQQFGDLLQSQYGNQLGQGAVYIERVQQAASRMSILIKDLLAFSRIATTQVDARPVALSELVEQVLEDLGVAIEESGAQLTIDSLLTVQGDESQLKQLVQNLLSNALKFRRKATAGEVVTPEVTLRTRLIPMAELPPSVQPTRYATAYHRIEVIDNGIGFEEKYLDRIFQVFQRLHGKNEFAGTGVGLAIVQKVVTNHGGAITASSQLGQGATFCVYLPA